MIYVVLRDRLGNNLFQLAAAKSLSDQVTICVEIKSEYAAIIKYQNTFFKGIPIIDFIPECDNYYTEPFYHYNRIPYVAGEDIVIDGYFQSYRYIDRHKVLTQYAIDDKTKSTIETRFPEILQGNYNSIHVRRGDYLKVQYKHPFSGKKYYFDAIKKIGVNEKFIVVSDDINWCKKQFKGDNFLFAEDTSPLIDFYIPSYCKNNIISNSSFGWWGAYLNSNPNKVVVAPKMWFGFKFPVNTSDLLPANYAVIDNKYSGFQYLISYFFYFITVFKFRTARFLNDH